MSSRRKTERAVGEGRPGGRRLSLSKRLLFSLVTLLLFLGALELLLALIGVEPAWQGGDPLVGFSRQLPHFVEEQDADGTRFMVTAPARDALNYQRFPKDKPAGTTRIACLGGSTTYGRPFWDETSFSAWLRAFLPAAEPDREWEVINGGGISYASYRVLNVMEELAGFEPDLFVIYLGHNEFLEWRTYGNLLDQPGIMKDFRASAHRLRTTTLVQRIADRITRRGENKAITLGEEVKRLPIDAVGPESYQRDDIHRAKVVRHFGISLNRMLDVAERCGAKVLLIVPASNFRHFAPFKSVHPDGLDGPALDTWRANYREAIQALGEGDFGSSVGLLEQCLAIDPRHAETHYHHGQCLLRLGRPGEARAAFARAIEEDVCPLRAIQSTCSVIRETAAARGAPLVDFQAVLDAQSEYGITGDDFFHDHLHLRIEANRLLAVAVMERMTDRGWLAPDWTPADRAAAVGELRGRMDPPRYAVELCKLSHVMDVLHQEHMALATVREALAMAPADREVREYALPFCAKRNMWLSFATLLEEQMRQAPEDRRVLAALGDAYSRMDRFAAAAAIYERLRVLEPGNVEVLELLGVALSRSGSHAEAVSRLSEAVRLNPQSAQLHNKLGLALAAGGDHGRAIGEYEEAVSLMPSLAAAWYNQGMSLVALERGEEAVVCFTRVLDLQPGNPEAIEQLRALGGERWSP